MNKKLILGTITLAAGLVAVTSQTAHAEDAPKSNINDYTDTGIGFFSTNNPGTGPFANNLSIAYTPSSFEFGNNHKLGTNKAFTAVYDQVAPSATQYLAVSDDRQDTGAKVDWSLNAKLANFSKVGDSAANTDLANAELSFTVGIPQKYDIKAAESDAQNFPTPIVGNLSDFASPFTTTYNGGAAKTVTLTAGASSKSAALGYSKGSLTDTDTANTLGVASEVTNVKLKVITHSNITEDARYTSKVNWTLDATPGA